MKREKVKRLLSLLVVFAVVAAAAPMAALGAETPGGDEASYVYSPWAEFDIFMASAAYGLGSEETYSDFTKGLTGEKFAPVCESLARAFGIDYTFEAQGGQLTRGQVVAALYEIITGGDPGAAADYFIKEGLIMGRGNGGYQLDEICTVEEMIVLSERSYEHMVYLAGEDSKGFFWRIEGEKNNVYLLGSVHLSDSASSVYPLSEAIEGAFKNSENIIVEANISEMTQENTNYIMEKGFISDGGTIEDYLSPETYEMYYEICLAIGLPEESFDYFKPWMAVLVLQQMIMAGGEAEQAQMNANLGIDMHFLMKAMQYHKNIIELESIEFQVDLLSSFSPELQEAQLQSVLLSLLQPEDAAASPEEQAETVRGEMRQLINTVKNGDEKALEEMLAAEDDDDPFIQEYNDRMFTERNKAMAEKIAGYLADETERGDYFVVVGAGHMIGTGGVVQLLSGKGYTVERIK